jgi:MFS family permease
VVPFLSIYLTRVRGFSIEQAGLVVALFGAGSIFSGPVAGTLSDRLGRKPVFIGALVMSAWSLLLLAVARTPGLIGACTAFYGFFATAGRPAVMAAIADVVPEEKRMSAFALHYWGINLAFAVAPVIAGLLWKLGPGLLFVGDAATSLCCVGLLLAFVPETRPSASSSRATGASLSVPFRDSPFVVFVLLTFVGAMVFQQFLVALPLDMTHKGLAPETYGALIAVNGVFIVVVQPLLGPRLQRFDPRRVIVAGTLIVGLGFGMTALAHRPAAFAASIATWTLGEILWLPLIPAVVAAFSPPNLRGGYQGASQLAWGASALLAPVVGTLVMARFGGAVLWAGCLLVMAATAAGHLAALRPALWPTRLTGASGDTK